MAGLFFCLAFAEGAGLLFCPTAIQHHTSVYNAFLHRPCRVIQPTPQNSAQGFTCAFPEIFPIPAHTVQQLHKPTMHRLRHAGRFTGQRSRPIIIMYIRVQHIADNASPAGSAPVVCGSLASATPGAPAEGSASPPVQGQPGGGLDASHARRLAIWHPPPGGAVWQQVRGGRRGTIDGYRRVSFRAFAR